MPRPFYPDYFAWKQVFERLSTEAESRLIGHSAGAEFILRWLSEDKDASVKQVVLVAPYRDETGKYGDFSNYDLNRNIVERVGRITIFSSLDDSDAIQENAHRLAAALPSSKLIELDGYGHFMIGNNMTGPEFPEIYEELVRK